jgi:xanthine dehydrogenase YagR molybdenum-binding subunit
MPDYSWPPLDKRKVMGKRLTRLDGTAKSSGRAKYSSDLKPEGMLFAELLTCPHAHARVSSIDISAAQKMPGVTAVRVISPAGTEIQWPGTEVAVVAANSETAARDAARAIKVEYELQVHVVKDDNLQAAGNRAKAAGEQVTGDPEKAFQESDVTTENTYGIPVITHCCLESHGSLIEWKGDHVQYFPSTQAVSTIGGDLAKSLQVPGANVHVQMQYMGGGFGSKFPADRWGEECARLSKESGGRPVKLFLDRPTELLIAGNRPSAYAKIKVGAKNDGSIIAWQSESWASGGVTGGGMPPIPYVFSKIPNYRLNHSAISTNTGPARAWRAPNHPQACFLTCSALEDLAAKLKMDPLELFTKNVGLTPRPDTYRRQLAKAAELAEWKKYWHPRGEGSGTIRRGLGIGLNTWGGAGHASKARTLIHPDGSVEVQLGSQDLGTGTRTIIAMVASETLGIPMSMIKVEIGDNSYPPSGPSGGSTTVGGVSSSTRKSTVNALNKLFEAVAPSLGVPAAELEAIDGRIRAKANPDKGMSWQQACQKLGVTPIDETGENNPQSPGGLNTGGASGVQIADVSVDMETGRVKMNRMVAVQDCGLVINPRTAESQVYGAMIMSTCAALMEEQVRDRITGKVLNADMEFYKLAGLADIGEMIVHMEIDPVNDKRGVIGLGEPPAIGGIAAIANAVANATGVRVPEVPLTPYRVLTALERRNA